jgi:hypothetical protein
MHLVDRIKSRLHRDIVADPRVHGLVLNLYLNGERYPQRVDDYFPIVDVTDPELADRMRRHVADEEKHVLLYEKAIERLQQPVLELDKADVFNEVIRTHTPVVLRIAADDDADTRSLKVAHFLAHVHFLEKRIARSLEYHVAACAHASCDYPQKAVGAVLKDEGRHVTYTQEAVRHLLPTQLASEVLALHRTAERRAHFDFSSRQLRRLTRDRHLPSTRRAAYATCAAFLRGVLYCV